MPRSVVVAAEAAESPVLLVHEQLECEPLGDLQRLRRPVQIRDRRAADGDQRDAAAGQVAGFAEAGLSNSTDAVATPHTAEKHEYDVPLPECSSIPRLCSRSRGKTQRRGRQEALGQPQRAARRPPSGRAGSTIRIVRIIPWSS